MNTYKFIPIVIYVIILVYGCSNDQPTNPPIITGPDSVLLNNNRKEFLVGANLPWLNYGHDFGQANCPTGTWCHDGISSKSSLFATDSLLAICELNGMKFLRCYLFCDGRAAPEFDSSGIVTGFDEYFYADFDSLLSLCNKHNIKLIVVLLDFLWLNNKLLGDNGVQLGGHSDIITDPAKSATFYDSCLIPLARRYSSSQTIAAWELMNEPEWRLSGYGGDYTSVSKEQILKFFGNCISILHENSSQPVTLGSAKYSFLQTWFSLDLDFYQIHCYEKNRYVPPFSSKTSLNCSKPVIIGEFPTASTSISFSEYLDASWNYGYAGSFAWSINAKDESTSWNNSMFLIFKDWIFKHTII
jgi:hypothetical protein